MSSLEDSLRHVTPDVPCDASQEVVVPAEALRQLMVELYAGHGVPRKHAEIAASRLLEADLRGIHSHGSRALPRYLNDIRQGHIDPKGQVSVVRETPALAVLDGGRSPGHYAATRAMELAIAKARACGTGTVLLRNSHHYGAASLYALMACRQEMIGYSTTSTAHATVAAYGSAVPATANHALAWGIPQRGGPAIVLDMAIGATSWGKIESLGMYGGTLPADWAVDKTGVPTTDPKAAKVILPAAGARGYGLGFVSSILAGPLAGGDVPLRKPWKQSPAEYPSEHFFYAIDIVQCTEPDDFFAKVAANAAEIRALPPAAGFDRVRLPGEREAEREAEWNQTGIPMHCTHAQKLAELAKEQGLTVPWCG